MGKVMRYMYSKEITRMDRAMCLIAISLMFYSIVVGLTFYIVSMIIELVVLNNKKFSLSQLRVLRDRVESMK